MKMAELQIDYQGILKLDTIGLLPNCVVVISEGVASLGNYPSMMSIRL